MKEQSENIENLFEKAGEYVETRLELFKLKTALATSDVMSELVARAIMVSIIIIIGMMVNIGIALWIGELLGKNYYGFLVVAGCYSILGGMLYIFREKWIKFPIANAIIKKMTRS
jgi:hypothetical protein